MLASPLAHVDLHYLSLILQVTMLALAVATASFNVPTPLQQGAAAAALSFLPAAAFADEGPSRMGGLLEPMIDTAKGYKIYKPAGWNMFDADPGVYDVKFQDIIESETTMQVATSPVATATSISALGDLDAVATKFAKTRSAEVVSATSRTVGDSLVYQVELKGEKYHELLALCINRGKLYRVSCVTGNKKWDKRKDLYKNIVLSFVPQGF